MATRREKLTVELEPELRDSLTRWAIEEDRPVGNLLRGIVAEAVRRRSPPPAPPWPPVRTAGNLDEAKAKLAALTVERAGLVKRNGPPARNYLSLQEQERLRWLHDEVANLEGEVRRFERQEERVA
jgi:hypothetical protein